MDQMIEAFTTGAGMLWKALWAPTMISFRLKMVRKALGWQLSTFLI